VAPFARRWIPLSTFIIRLSEDLRVTTTKAEIPIPMSNSPQPRTGYTPSGLPTACSAVAQPLPIGLKSPPRLPGSRSIVVNSIAMNLTA